MLTALAPGRAFLSAAVLVLCGGASTNATRAQAVAEPAAPGAAASSVTPRQQTWLEAGVSGRVALAEEIGEEGGRAFARAKGWAPVYDGKSWSMIHGPDQVYRGVDGTVHMIEAKGGSGQLGQGYGHLQGSSEWAVEAAKRVLRSPSATEAERQGAIAVIDAANRGKLEVHVIRTTHTLGEPHVAKLEQTVRCSEQATKLAREALGATVKSAGKTINKVVQASDDAARLADDAARVADDIVRSADDIARAASSSSGSAVGGTKILGPAGIAIDASVRVADGIETERKFEAGEISDRERAIAHGRNVAGMAGGMSGAWAGAEAGTAGGAAIGTFICPGFGTAIGGFVGGVAGGIGGYFAGDAVAAAGAEAVIDAAYTAQ